MLNPGIYENLIDAERETLSRGGREVGKVALIKALREATGLGLADAKEVVEIYFARRAGPGAGVSVGGPEAGRIDGLLDAERAAATREGRPITKIGLIKAVRQAGGLGLKPAKDAVEDYLHRRGGEGLRSGPGAGTAVGLVVVVLLMIAGGFVGWFWR